MISELLAQFISSCNYDTLPDPVRDMARRCVLDWMGSAIRGSIEPPARMYADVAREEGGEARASTVCGQLRTSVAWAAQINAAASHTVEMDDLHPGSVLHAAAPIIATLPGIRQGAGQPTSLSSLTCAPLSLRTRFARRSRRVLLLPQLKQQRIEKDRPLRAQQAFAPAVQCAGVGNCPRDAPPRVCVAAGN